MKLKFPLVHDSVSYEILNKAIKTLPFIPSQSSVKLYADGLIPLDCENAEESNILEDIRYCKTAKIIPFSYMDLEYDREKKTFFPYKYDNPCIVNCHESKTVIDQQLNAIVKGGRMQEIALDLPNSEAFNSFIGNGCEGLYDLLLKESYLIGECELLRTSDKNGKYYFRSKITDRTKQLSKLEFELEMYPTCPEEESKNLASWFNQLIEKQH